MQNQPILTISFFTKISRNRVNHHVDNKIHAHPRCKKRINPNFSCKLIVHILDIHCSEHHKNFRPSPITKYNINMKNTTTPQIQKQPIHKSKTKHKRENVAQNYTNLAIILKNHESCPSHKLQKSATMIKPLKTQSQTGVIANLKTIPWYEKSYRTV